MPAAEQALQRIDTAGIFERRRELPHGVHDAPEVEPGAVQEQQSLGVVEVSRASRDKLVDHEIVRPGHRHDDSGVVAALAPPDRVALERQPGKAQIERNPRRRVAYEQHLPFTGEAHRTVHPWLDRVAAQDLEDLLQREIAEGERRVDVGGHGGAPRAMTASPPMTSHGI